MLPLVVKASTYETKKRVSYVLYCSCELSYRSFFLHDVIMQHTWSEISCDRFFRQPRPKLFHCSYSRSQVSLAPVDCVYSCSTVLLVTVHHSLFSSAQNYNHLHLNVNFRRITSKSIPPLKAVPAWHDGSQDGSVTEFTQASEWRYVEL